MADPPSDADGHRSSPRRIARTLAVGFGLHLKMMSRSSFDGLLGVLWPLFFATVAFLMFRAGAGGESLVFASFGAAVMGIWSSTSTSAGSAMQRERWHGTLELLVTAPVHFAAILLPVTIAMSAMGLYSMTATLLISRFVFGVDLPFEQPLSFAVALVVAFVSLRRLSMEAIPAAILAAVVAAAVPLLGYAAVVATPFAGARLGRRAESRHAGLRILAKD